MPEIKPYSPTDNKEKMSSSLAAKNESVTRENKRDVSFFDGPDEISEQQTTSDTYKAEDCSTCEVARTSPPHLRIVVPKQNGTVEARQVPQVQTQVKADHQPGLLGNLRKQFFPARSTNGKY